MDAVAHAENFCHRRARRGQSLQNSFVASIHHTASAIGFALAVFAWSLVSGMTGLATGFVGLLAFRLLLGVMESANWPASLRIVA